ncbi:MAG TPA: ATP-binding cassette domain-containing protein [Chthoniobacteraceae bacterium]|jgi:ABC-type multidrug transport system ATPase subunit|nr:ATP-binding cassette domain-containing protein [Chthoniobacteraceae bacterium]
MLELIDVTLATTPARDDAWLLHAISARLPPGHLCAIVGPSGCGKSTLLKVIAGVRVPEEGTILWEGRNLEERDLEPHEIGYVPQFSIAYDLLTVQESVETALRLRVGGQTADERRERATGILVSVGMSDIADRRVGVLSGGQKRRLALALELVSSPTLLLCDEVTSGLDPLAEDEIVRLLRILATPDAGGAPPEAGAVPRTVLSVTHSLRHLALHDSVAVLFQGHLIFHGPPAVLPFYFGIEHADDLFPTLTKRTAEEWHGSWQKHRAGYEASLHDDDQPVARAEDIPVPVESGDKPAAPSPPAAPEFQRPQWTEQFVTLLTRRWRLLLRDRGQCALQAALLFGFPCLVVIFAWDGLPQIQNLTGTGNALQQLMEKAADALHSSRTAGLVSGLVMFQVILLTLVGSNNGAREIAGERTVFEKEKFAGVRVTGYIASKAAFLAVLVLAQSLWMAVFVNVICRFPGDLVTQAGLLVLVNGAMTAICLGISSITKSAEHASLICVYLVGFQLPLSGAVLALPKFLGWITQPVIAAYWGWSGYLQTMRDTRFYDVVQSVSQTELSPLGLCGWVLVFHILAGLLLAYLGSRHSRWE